MTDRTTDLETLLADLPEEKAQEVLDFAAFLHEQYAPNARRGSAAAILDAIDSTGPLEFDDGELDHLLSDLESMRRLDLADHDQVSAGY